MYRVIDNIGEHFGPIEEKLETVFIPALLGGKNGEKLRDLRAKDGYRASLECTKALTASLIARTDIDATGYASS